MAAKIEVTGFTLHGESVSRDVRDTGPEMQSFLDQCSYADWFEGNVLGREFPTVEAAWTAAEAAYLGDDPNGLGVAWEVV